MELRLALITAAADAVAKEENSFLCPVCAKALGIWDIEAWGKHQCTPPGEAEEAFVNFVFRPGFARLEDEPPEVGRLLEEVVGLKSRIQLRNRQIRDLRRQLRK